MLPEDCIRLLVGVEPKDKTKPKIGRREDLLLAASKVNNGDLSQSNVSPKSKIGEVLSWRYMHIHEGAWAEENSAQNWGKGWQSPSVSWLKSGGSTSSFHPPLEQGALAPTELKDCIKLLCIFLRRNQDSVLLLNYCFLTAFSLFLNSLTPLKIVDY